MKREDLEIGVKVLADNYWNIVYTVEKINKRTVWLRYDEFLYKNIKMSSLKPVKN